MITEQEYKAAVAQSEAAQKIINAYGKQSIESFRARWDRFDKHNEYFKDDDLVYSAGARCKKCGAGLAYPKDCDPWHQWTCSNVLKGIGTDKGHEAFPFAFNETKSEVESSAQGATTRPKPAEAKP